jgi:hypothetical protein
MSAGDGEPNRRIVARFFGGLLIAAGALVAALCGLCTLVFIIGGSLSSNSSEFGGDGMVVVALIVGGVPTVLGGLMIWGGVAIVRGRRRRDPKVRPDTFD